jgi:hypothetical protein
MSEIDLYVGAPHGSCGRCVHGHPGNLCDELAAATAGNGVSEADLDIETCGSSKLECEASEESEPRGDSRYLREADDAVESDVGSTTPCEADGESELRGDSRCSRAADDAVESDVGTTTRAKRTVKANREVIRGARVQQTMESNQMLVRRPVRSGR